jgi:2-polyprenyl-3-methyl-5-hydroxy-6-metoxy-1,4-benzoquinol methylase
MQLSTIALTQTENAEIERLLSFAENSPLDLNDLWRMMDIVWDEMGCDSENLDFDKISAYYSHPIWTLNGLFIEQDQVSMGHREAMATWITSNNISNVLDYGGGFGTLARLIATKDREIKIDIHEPFPSQLAIAKMQEFSNVNFVSSFDRSYDCLVCIDVLEHVDNPLELFGTMIENVKVGGFLVIANCFHPDIKCHLPSTFHFRHTFDQFARVMGLQVMGRCDGSHAMLYKKVEAKAFDWKKIHELEQQSRKNFPVNQAISSSKSSVKKLVKSMIGK